MGYSIRNDVSRAWEIFKHFPKIHVSRKVNDFAAIERNLIVAKKAREIFAQAALFLSGVGGAALYYSITPLALGSAALILISLVVAARFHFFLRSITSTHAFRTHIDYILQELEAAVIDWGSGVPDVSQRPVRVNPGANNFNNLYQICESMPFIYKDPPEERPSLPGALPHIRFTPSHGLYKYDDTVKVRIKALLEKCWAFALRQEHPSHYIYGCHLARWGQTGNTSFKEEMVRDDKNLGLVTFTCGDVKLKLPHYMKALLCRYSYGDVMTLREDVDGVSVQNIQPKDFLLHIIDTFYPQGPNPSQGDKQTRKAIIREWYGQCFSRDIEGFNTLRALLKTLGNTPKENYLKKILAKVLAIPQGVVLDTQLEQDLNAVGVRRIVCYATIGEEGWTAEAILALAQNVPTIRSFILKKGHGNDEALLNALATQLQAVRPNLYMAIEKKTRSFRAG